ncbi:MAG TPA: Uma2 family endonuclease [Sporichthyaceae bacterium]|nr:Uma2 family endonuclease [Sporichthyaceae bacterium]
MERLIKQRQALGHDLYDEVWEGEYHMVPGPGGKHSGLQFQLLFALEPLARAAGLRGSGPFNIGDSERSFRVPDGGFHRGTLDRVWFPTAAIVVEILSPGDETWAKFDYYAAHRVDEICVADPEARTIRWFRRDSASYLPVDRSELLDVTVADLEATVDWPS